MFERDIAEGITILNRHDLGWAHRISVDELDMSAYPKDILGQLYGDIDDEIKLKILRDYQYTESFCGFTILDAEDNDPLWGTLTREWQRIIRRIQEKIPADEPFTAELGSLWEREE